MFSSDCVSQCLYFLAPDHDYLALTDDGPDGMINVKNPGGTLIAAVGDGTTDDTSAIQDIIDLAAGGTNNKVFFPPGKYLVSSDIVIPGSVELHGTEIGIAIIKALTPYANKIKNTKAVSTVKLQNLYFDGIRVEFDKEKTKDIRVFHCVFFSRANPSESNAKNPQLKMKRLADGDVDTCVFLRDSNAFGVATQFTGTVGVKVHYNIFGLDLGKIDWLPRQLASVSTLSYWTEQTRKLKYLKTNYSLSSDQGFFKSSLYEECDKQMFIYKNVFNASPNTRDSQLKDHVMYLKGFNGTRVISNYVRGWPANKYGGIKARNGILLQIASNYIDDTGILLYTHTKTKDCLYDGLKDVVIYGNHIIQRSNPDNSTSGIRYYEPHYTGRDDNISYSANEFEIVGVSDPTKYKCIWLTNGDLSHHHVYKDNVYFGTNTKVKLEARPKPPSFEPGSIDAFISALYSYCPYKLNIPTYQ